MKSNAYLIIGKTGIRGVRRSKPPLKWDEIAIRVLLDIPDQLFTRPQIEATISVSPEVAPEQIDPQIIINTKELIEQSTGCKIEFRVVKEEEKHV